MEKDVKMGVVGERKEMRGKKNEGRKVRGPAKPFGDPAKNKLVVEIVVDACIWIQQRL